MGICVAGFNMSGTYTSRYVTHQIWLDNNITFNNK